MAEFEAQAQRRFDVVRRTVQAICALDLAPARPDMADDLLVEFPFAPDSWGDRATITGADAFVTWFKSVDARYDTFNLMIDQLYACQPDAVLMEAHSDCRRKDGTLYANRYAILIRFTGDRIIGWKEYFNPLKL